MLELELEDITPMTNFWKPYLILFYCKYQNKNCFGKLYFFTDDNAKEKYTKEIEMAKFIKKNLSQNTQHIANMIRFTKINGKDFYKKVASELAPKHVKYISKNVDKEARLIIYEYVGKFPLKTYLNRMSQTEFNKVLMQIYLTLKDFRSLDFCHGDLFINTNIMLKKLDNPIDIAYNINNTTYKLPKVKWYVKIIDFDHSTININCTDHEYLEYSLMKFNKNKKIQAFEKLSKDYIS